MNMGPRGVAPVWRSRAGPALLLLLVCASLTQDFSCHEVQAASQESASSPDWTTTTTRNRSSEISTTGRLDRPDRRPVAESGPTTTANRTQRARRRARSGPKALPEFSAPIGNVSAVLGRDVRLVCTVENLGQHQVAWLKEESKTILSIDTNIIITNYRIFLIPDEEGRKWVLHIKDVQESDRGLYQCQVNTNPMRSTSGYLEVVVPPAIIESETTQVAEVVEGANATVQCKASGHPRPLISWRREDGEPIRLAEQVRAMRANGSSSWPTVEGATASHKLVGAGGQRAVTRLADVKSDRLHFTNIDRSMAGLYVCTASNGIPSQVSRQIPLYVKFPPRVSIGESVIAVNPGEQLEIDCFIEAFPKPTSYWSERQLPEVFRSQPGQGPAAMRFRLAGGEQAAVAMHQRNLFNRDGPNAVQLGWPGELVQVARGRRRRRLSSNSNQRPPEDSPDEEDEDEQQAQDAPVGLGESTLPKAAATDPPPPVAKLRPPAKSAGGLVTVKQTAINPYTYKLKISIARMRPSDFGEYVCISSNSMGSSSARVLVKRAERNQMPPAAAAVGGGSLARPLSLTEAAGENSAEYQRDGMGDEGPPGVLAPLGGNLGGHQFIQASKSVSPPPYSQEPARRTNFNVMVKQPSRVYDENYLQSIRNRQLASNGYAVGPRAIAFGDRSNGAANPIAQIHLGWLAAILSLSLLATFYRFPSKPERAGRL